MKKILSMLLVLSMLLGCSVAMAEMGVQVIGGPDVDSEPVSLDDVKLNTKVTIDGYGELTLTQFTYENRLLSYEAGSSINAMGYDSGADADFAILRADITNIAVTARDFLANCEVKCVFDDVYEYQGWVYQYNYDNKTGEYSYSRFSNGDCVGYTDAQTFVIAKDDNFAINPMYTGHYCFGCTLPNAVVNSKKPLRIVIMMDGNEITYNIRK